MQGLIYNSIMLFLLIIQCQTFTLNTNIKLKQVNARAQSLDTYIIDTYKADKKTFCYSMYTNNENGQNFLYTTLHYTPIDLLKNIDEETEYNEIFALLDAPSEFTQQEFEDACSLTEIANETFLNQIDDQELKEKLRPHLEKSTAIFRNFNSFTDEQFLDAIIDYFKGYQKEQFFKNPQYLKLFESQDGTNNRIVESMQENITLFSEKPEQYPSIIRPILLVDAINGMRKMGMTIESVLQNARILFQESQENVPTKELFRTIFNDANVKHMKIFGISIGKKLARALLKKHLGTSAKAYAEKKRNELDTVILNDIAAMNLTFETAQTVQLDENTTCTIEPFYNHLMEKTTLDITCKTKLN
ncbi:hypothetical protein IPH25_03835 [bacterium]|nr:MAG: hypothetical protein IPG37_00830 [bacterium]QQR61582.1 MAG: hypothetical protein IPH25_03835 [bacterium]QQR62882.1 MAG: hypothetical protein IPH67_00110 [bacterium]